MWQSDVALTPISCQDQDISAASSRCLCVCYATAKEIRLRITFRRRKGVVEQLGGWPRLYRAKWGWESGPRLCRPFKAIRSASLVAIGIYRPPFPAQRVPAEASG
jgi:hypothetical protein